LYEAGKSYSFLEAKGSWLFSRQIRKLLAVLASKLGHHKWHTFLTVDFFLPF